MNSEAAGPTTVSQDLLAATLGALMTLGAGLLVLIGYLWLSVFGAVLGVAGVVAWGVWWHKRYGQLFPKELTGRTVARLALLIGVLAVIFAAGL